VSETPLTHEQFAWLMSLPPDHPERRAWSGRPEFESMRSLYERFEGADRSGAALDAASEAELERRFREALPSRPAVEASGWRPAARVERPARSWWLLIPRPALAVAAVVVVATAGLWFAGRPRTTMMRGAEDAPVIEEPRPISNGLEIRWTAVAGAESYRLSFVDDSMREIAAVEAWPSTSYLLDPAALPPGLGRGARVIVEVRPVRGGSAGAAATRSIVVP